MAGRAMASTKDLDVASTYDRRMKQKVVGEDFPDPVYIQYADDMERIRKQQVATLIVLKYYRETDLIPTNRRLIPDDTDMHLLIEALGLDDID